MKTIRVSRRGWQATAVLLTGIAVAVIAGLSHREETVGVIVIRPSASDVDDRVTTNGTVIPTSEFQARAFWPGIVQKVYVELGDHVKPGQMLVSMEDPLAYSRLATAQANLQEARVSYEDVHKEGTQQDRIALDGDLSQAQLSLAQASKDLSALQRLQQQGAASAAEVSAEQQKLDSATAALKTLQEKKTNRFSANDITNSATHLKEMQAALDAAKNQFGNANISSPMEGTVYTIGVVAYDFVPVGADLIRVADLKRVEVKAYFDEPQIGKLKAGQPVAIHWDGLPAREWHGHIKQAPMAATALGARSVGECLITVDDANEDLLPNTNVMVTATILEHKNVMAVPRNALHADGPQNFVYRVIDNRLRRTPVQVGVVNLEKAEITGGLGVQDFVVLRAVDNRDLQDGMKVLAIR